MAAARVLRRPSAIGRCGTRVATTTRPEDEAVLAAAHALGVEGVAGPDDDVLARFALVVRAHPEAAVILRATADNPFVDVGTPERILKALSAGADYAVEEGLPVGTAVEGVRREVLLQAQQEATAAYDREHVTPWVRRAPAVVRVTPTAPPDVRAPDLQLTVDTPADLAFARRLAEALQAEGHDPRFASLPRVIATARRLPTTEVA
jgi:spore coat polysaccharide biosynthesis protein SpsF